VVLREFLVTDLEWDEIVELMEEPPGGDNHGRVKGANGWKSLEASYEADLPYLVEDPEWRTGRRRKKEPWEIVHGTRSAYVNDQCRCDDCRTANREYIRALRDL
jgi:hypothetical protein